MDIEEKLFQYICSYCSKLVLNAKKSWGSSFNQTLCRNCYDKAISVKCHMCKKILKCKKDRHKTGGNLYCKKCILDAKHQVKCHKCKEVLKCDEDIHRIDRFGSNPYCKECIVNVRNTLQDIKMKFNANKFSLMYQPLVVTTKILDSAPSTPSCTPEIKQELAADTTTMVCTMCNKTLQNPRDRRGIKKNQCFCRRCYEKWKAGNCSLCKKIISDSRCSVRTEDNQIFHNKCHLRYNVNQMKANFKEISLDQLEMQTLEDVSCRPLVSTAVAENPDIETTPASTTDGSTNVNEMKANCNEISLNQLEMQTLEDVSCATLVSIAITENPDIETTPARTTDRSTASCTLCRKRISKSRYSITTADNQIYHKRCHWRYKVSQVKANKKKNSLNKVKMQTVKLEDVSSRTLVHSMISENPDAEPTPASRTDGSTMVCTVCKKTIEHLRDRRGSRNNQSFCRSCYDKTRARNCSLCEKRIHDPRYQMTTADNKILCRNCFLCSDVNPIDPKKNKNKVKVQTLKLEDVSCRTLIPTRVTDTEPTSVICTMCKKIILHEKDQRGMENNQTLCKSCYNRRIAIVCCVCKQKIIPPSDRRGWKKNQSYCKSCWHKRRTKEKVIKQLVERSLKRSIKKKKKKNLPKLMAISREFSKQGAGSGMPRLSKALMICTECKKEIKHRKDRRGSRTNQCFCRPCYDQLRKKLKRKPKIKGALPRVRPCCYCYRSVTIEDGQQGTIGNKVICKQCSNLKQFSAKKISLESSEPSESPPEVAIGSSDLEGTGGSGVVATYKNVTVNPFPECSIVVEHLMLDKYLSSENYVSDSPPPRYDQISDSDPELCLSPVSSNCDDSPCLELCDMDTSDLQTTEPSPRDGPQNVEESNQAISNTEPLDSLDNLYSSVPDLLIPFDLEMPENSVGEMPTLVVNGQEGAILEKEHMQEDSGDVPLVSADKGAEAAPLVTASTSAENPVANRKSKTSQGNSLPKSTKSNPKTQNVLSKSTRKTVTRKLRKMFSKLLRHKAQTGPDSLALCLAKGLLSKPGLQRRLHKTLSELNQKKQKNQTSHVSTQTEHSQQLSCDTNPSHTEDSVEILVSSREITASPVKSESDGVTNSIGEGIAASQTDESHLHVSPTKADLPHSEQANCFSVHSYQLVQNMDEQNTFITESPVEILVSSRENPASPMKSESDGATNSIVDGIAESQNEESQLQVSPPKTGLPHSDQVTFISDHPYELAQSMDHQKIFCTEANVSNPSEDSCEVKEAILTETIKNEEELDESLAGNKSSVMNGETQLQQRMPEATVSESQEQKHGSADSQSNEKVCNLPLKIECEDEK